MPSVLHTDWVADTRVIIWGLCVNKIEPSYREAPEVLTSPEALPGAGRHIGKIIFDGNPDVLIVGQTVIVEEGLMRSIWGSPKRIIIRYSQRSLADGSYVIRSLQELPYQFNCPKKPEILLSLFTHDALITALRERDESRLNDAILSLPSDHLSKQIYQIAPAAPPVQNRPIILFAQNPMFDFHFIRPKIEIPSEWKETYFDVALVENRAVVRLHGNWQSQTPASGFLEALLHQLARRQIKDVIVDSRTAVGVGVNLMMSIENIKHRAMSNDNYYEFVYDKKINPGEILAKAGRIIDKDIDWGGMVFVRCRRPNPLDEILATQDEYLNGTQLGIFVLPNRRVNIRSFNSRGIFQWAAIPEGSYSQLVVPALTAERANRHLDSALRSLEDVVNHPKSKEADVQKLLEESPIIFRMLGYEFVQPHLVLVEADESRKLIPDFFLRPGEQSLVEILELKSPHTPLVVGRGRRRLSSGVLDGIQQLFQYYEWFEQSGNRTRFYQRYGISGYRPGLTLIAGRNATWEQSELDRVARQLPAPVRLLTYQDLLGLAHRRLLF